MVPLRVLTIVVDLVIIVNIREGRGLLAAQPVGAGRGAGEVAAGGGGGGAGMDLEIVVVGNEGLVGVISLVFAILGGPRGGVPNRAIHPHRPRRKCVVAFPRVPSDRNIIHVEYDLIWIPKNGIVVKIRGGVEPKVKFNLSPNNVRAITTPFYVYICLQHVGLILCGAQKLYVYLIMTSRVLLVV